MPQLSCKILHRGPTSTIMISLSRAQVEDGYMQTEIINVKGMVDVMLKFKLFSGGDIGSSIRMRKKEGASSSNCLIMISGTFNEQFTCSDKWTECELNLKPFDKRLIVKNTSIFSYFIDINITVHLLGSIVMLPNYNLYEDTEFTDFELQATDGKVAVHKTTLLSQSDAFKAIMRGEWKENAEGVMKIEGVTVQTLQHLKAYMYKGTLPDEGLDLLLMVAARYLMDKLVSLCITKLVETMKPEDFDGLIKLAIQHNMPDLVKCLVLRIPDDVVNGIHQLENNVHESMEK